MHVKLKRPRKRTTAPHCRPLTAVDVVEEPPEGAVRRVDAERGEVAAVEAGDAVRAVDGADDGARHAERTARRLRLRRGARQPERVEVADGARLRCPGQLEVLRDDVDGHHERLADDGRNAARHQRLHLQTATGRTLEGATGHGGATGNGVERTDGVSLLSRTQTCAPQENDGSGFSFSACSDQFR